jgi:hypothetical protein
MPREREEDYDEQQGNEYQNMPMGGMPYPMMKDGKADLFEKINPNSVVVDIAQRLMGKEFIEGAWVMNPVLKEIAISERGAWRLAVRLSSISNKNTSLTNLDDDSIRKIVVRNIANALAEIVNNYKDYEIRGRDQIYFLGDIIQNIIFIMLKQPENEGIRDLLKGTTQESRIIQDQQKKGGFMDGVFGRFKR